MKRHLRLLIVIYLGMLSSLYAYKVSTTDVTAYVHNSEFSSLEGWHPYYTDPLTDVSLVTCMGNSGVLLRSYYCSTTVSATAGIRLYSDGNDYFPINLVDANTTGIVRDALIVRVQLIGSPDVLGTESHGVITGNIGVTLQGGLSCSTDAFHPNPSYMTDNRIYETGGFIVSTSQPYFGMVTSWMDLSFTFIPPGQCDWWQIRNMEIYYQAMPNQPSESGIVINKIDMYAIRVDAE